MTDIDFKTQLADRLKKRSSGEGFVAPPTSNPPQKLPPQPSSRNSVISPSFLSPPQSPRQANVPTSPLLKPPIPDRKNLQAQKSSSLGSLPTPPSKITSFTPPPPPPSSVSMNNLAMPSNVQHLPPPPPPPSANYPPPPPPSFLSTPPPPVAPREPSQHSPSVSPQYKKSPPQTRHAINHPPPPPIPGQNHSHVHSPSNFAPKQAPPPPSQNLPPITISSPTMTPPPPPTANPPLVLPNRPKPSVQHARSSSLDPKVISQIQNSVGAGAPVGHASFANNAPQPQPHVQKRLSSDLQQKRLSQDAMKLNSMLNNRLSGGLSPPIAKPFFDDKVLSNNSKAAELNNKRDQEEQERKEREQKKKKDQEKKDQEKKEKKEKKEQEKKDKKDKKDKKSSSASSSDSHNTNIFSNSLTQVMEIQREKLSEYSHLSYPVILKILTDSIISLDGCSTEGIFRVPGTSSEVMRIRQRINELDFSLDTTDVHVLAGLLKLWLRELADPIIPSSIYDDCIKSWNSKNDSLRILNSIPTPNKDVLFFILNFLKTVSDPIYFSKSKMDIDNIAMVFAPGLLRCPSTDPNSLLLNSQYEKDFIKNLIEIV